MRRIKSKETMKKRQAFNKCEKHKALPNDDSFTEVKSNTGMPQCYPSPDINKALSYRNATRSLLLCPSPQSHGSMHHMLMASFENTQPTKTVTFPPLANAFLQRSSLDKESQKELLECASTTCSSTLQKQSNRYKIEHLT